MKRNGFTLIELIFVILIIGVLSAVAVPKFKNLKQNAEASNVLKVGKDAFATIPSSYVNLVDLEGEEFGDANVTLTDLVSIDGKNWNIDMTTDANTSQTAKYMDNNQTANTVVTLTLDRQDRNVSIAIDCTKFIDTTTQKKCKKNIGGQDTSNQTLNF